MKNFRRLAITSILLVAFAFANAPATSLLSTPGMNSGSESGARRLVIARKASTMLFASIFEAPKGGYSGSEARMESETYMASVMRALFLAPTNYSVNPIADTDNGAVRLP